MPREKKGSKVGLVDRGSRVGLVDRISEVGLVGRVGDRVRWEGLVGCGVS